MTLVRFKNRPTINNFIDSAIPVFPSLLRDEFLTTGFQPSVPVNVIEKEEAYVLELIVPGFEKEQFNINIEQDTLTVSAELKTEENKESEKEIRKEYKPKAFRKSFTLPELTDAENISAQYVNGVLTLNLPLKAAVKQETKKITIL
jgi:HSP20 family protein